MVRLSVNVNKVAVLRNSRGGDEPCLIQVVEDLIQFGAWGITLHPRPDGRHILYQDVRDIAQCVQKSPSVELNIEGYPSEIFLDLIKETHPHQCTLVPDPPSALTSDQGWDLEDQFSFLEKVLGFFKKNKVRSSVFIDPLCFNLSALQKLCPDRVEFYTGKWAKTFDHVSQKETPSKAGVQKTVSQNETNGDIALSKEFLKILETYKIASEQIHKLGIGVNAGHDLNQQNLKPLIEMVPLIQEVSIGHALISEALYDGLQATLKNYHQLLK